MATIAEQWERVTSQGQLVCWRRGLSDGRWLAVTQVDDRWLWAAYSPGQAEVTGWRRSMRVARDAANQWAWTADNPAPVSAAS